MRDRLIAAFCWLGIFLCTAGMSLTVTATRVHGHDPLTHQVNSLGDARSIGWGLCCNGKDYIVPKDWKQVEGGYKVLIGTVWLDVPKDAEVTNMQNPDMEAKVWLLQGEGESYVRCFMRGAQT